MARQAGCVSYLTKPIDRQRLLSVVGNCLQKVTQSRRTNLWTPRGCKPQELRSTSQIPLCQWGYSVPFPCRFLCPREFLPASRKKSYLLLAEALTKRSTICRTCSETTQPQGAIPLTFESSAPLPGGFVARLNEVQGMKTRSRIIIPTLVATALIMAVGVLFVEWTFRVETQRSGKAIAKAMVAKIHDQEQQVGASVPRARPQFTVELLPFRRRTGSPIRATLPTKMTPKPRMLALFFVKLSQPRRKVTRRYLANRSIGFTFISLAFAACFAVGDLRRIVVMT